MYVYKFIGLLLQGWRTSSTQRAKILNCESQRATPRSDLPKQTNTHTKAYNFNNNFCLRSSVPLGNSLSILAWRVLK